MATFQHLLEGEGLDDGYEVPVRHFREECREDVSEEFAGGPVPSRVVSSSGGGDRRPEVTTIYYSAPGPRAPLHKFAAQAPLNQWEQFYAGRGQ
jgi:hypothetical protein